MIPNENIFSCVMKNYTPKPIRKNGGEGYKWYDDKTIGEANIDIEDRYWAKQKELISACYNGTKQSIREEEKMTENSGANKKIEANKKRNELKKKENALDAWYDKQAYAKKEKQPIEFISLWSGKGSVSVGQAQSLLEVLTVKEARITPKAQFQDQNVSGIFNPYFY